MSRWPERIFPLGIPLPWRQLTSEPKRFLAAVAGIMVAVTMMLFQLGLHDALFQTAIRHQAAMIGDVAIVSKLYSYLAVSGEFPRRRLAQALADPGVESAASVYLGASMWKNPATLQSRMIFMMAIRPGERAFDFPCLREQPAVLQAADEAFFDSYAREEFGSIADLMRRQPVVASELNGARMTVKGLFPMGATFAADGTILMGDLAFFRVLPTFPREMVSVGLLRLRPGHPPGEVAARLRGILPDDVRVLTRSEFLEVDRSYWARRTPIGFVISASLVVGLLVGGVILYQILYADVNDHLAEYATLKGIGFADGFFTRLVIQQSLIMSVAGFVPGVIVSAGLFRLTAVMTNLPVELTFGRAALVFALTAGMCAAGGGLAARKLRWASPADLF